MTMKRQEHNAFETSAVEAWQHSHCSGAGGGSYVRTSKPREKA